MLTTKKLPVLCREIAAPILMAFEEPGSILGQQ
jgi:hypothetical protein